MLRRHSRLYVGTHTRLFPLPCFKPSRCHVPFHRLSCRELRTALTVALLAINLLVGSIVALGQSEDLQPLKYNNPGLTVDLGVGLWAFPAPLDYDHDGDMDLLVKFYDDLPRSLLFDDVLQKIQHG